MSTPSTADQTPLPAFARSAAATFTDLAHQATALDAPGSAALAGLLAAGAAELSTLVGDSALAGLSVPARSETGSPSAGGLGRLLVVPLQLSRSLTVALTVACSGSATGTAQARLIQAAMVAARREAGLRMAAALAAAGQLSLLGTQQLASAAPGATGSVGTPSAFAPVVAT